MSQSQHDHQGGPVQSPQAQAADYEAVEVDMDDREDTMAGSTPPPFYAPPPHLAARFYKTKAVARRKSSAASSRRNSMSSAPSHASSISQRRGSSLGSQSNYVAQHLRRASIIESRKARLADRAAHAEQVRLRAALAKATPRASLSNSEEKALNAQLAKEKYLAKVAAACAEEVARAKRIAEEVKERKLAEEARARLEMEERHAEAERRRAEYQRNLQARRTRRSDSTEKKLATLVEVADVDEEAVLEDVKEESAQKQLSKEEAAARLQRSVRLYLRRKIVRSFCDIDLLARSTKDSFEDMTALVADAGTISATTGILTHIGLQDKNDENAALNSRTFLSAYMITGHPIAVLNNKNGAQEQDLMAKATELIQSFESVISRLAPWNNFTPNPTQLESLSQSYSAYTSAFAAWRLQDSSILIEGMVASFVELDAIWQTVKDDSRGEVASDYREGIRDNQVMLLARIRKLAGPDRADFLIKKAIRESRKRRPKKRAAAEVRPRMIESAESHPPVAEATLDAVVERPVVNGARPESQSPYTGLDLTKLFTPMPTNRVLTHELAINKDYRLEDRQSELRDQLYRTICESMKHGFEAGDGAAWTVSAAENIREKLLRMLKPGNSMHTLISENMDLEYINRQCQHGVFSYSGFFQFIANVLPKLCAPFRDTEIKALAEELLNGDDGIDNMIEKLFKVLRAVDSLSLDYTNFMIMNAAPMLIREAAGYEQRMFAKDLESDAVTLERTKNWLRSSYNNLTAEANRRDPEAVRNPADRPSTHKVYAQALLGLALEQNSLRADAVPETLALDFDRLSQIHEKAVRITIIGAVLLNAKNLLRRDSRSQWKNEATLLWKLLSTNPYSTVDSEATAESDELSTADKAFAILESAHNMPPTTKSHLQATITRFFTQAAAVTAPNSTTRFTDPVLKVLFQRLKTHIGVRLSAATSSERVRAASGASEALASCGMPEFVAHVGAIVEVLERVREVDWAGHGNWYNDIFSEISRNGGEA